MLRLNSSAWHGEGYKKLLENRKKTKTNQNKKTQTTKTPPLAFMPVNFTLPCFICREYKEPGADLGQTALSSLAQKPYRTNEISFST